jgi:hypothetical protein
VDAHADDFGVGANGDRLHAPDVRTAIRSGLSESRIRALGVARIATGGVNNVELEDE